MNQPIAVHCGHDQPDCACVPHFRYPSHPCFFYREKLGFECLGTWSDPPVYAILARDQRVIHFRCAAPPSPSLDKYKEELLDAYIYVEDADALYAEFAAKGVEFVRGLGDMPWKCREFVVKDCDGRLLAFGADL